MTEHAELWGFALMVAVAGVVALFHAGVNIGGDLGGFVRSVEHLFALPL